MHPWIPVRASPGRNDDGRVAQPAPIRQSTIANRQLTCLAILHRFFVSLLPGFASDPAPVQVPVIWPLTADGLPLPSLAGSPRSASSFIACSTGMRTAPLLESTQPYVVSCLLSCSTINFRLGTGVVWSLGSGGCCGL